VYNTLITHYAAPRFTYSRSWLLLRRSALFDQVPARHVASRALIITSLPISIDAPINRSITPSAPIIHRVTPTTVIPTTGATLSRASIKPTILKRPIGKARAPCLPLPASRKLPPVRGGGGGGGGGGGDPAGDPVVENQYRRPDRGRDRISHELMEPLRGEPELADDGRACALDFRSPVPG